MSAFQHSDDDVKAIFRAARGYAGGKGKARKLLLAVVTDLALLNMVRMGNTRLSLETGHRLGRPFEKCAVMSRKPLAVGRCLSFHVFSALP